MNLEKLKESARRFEQKEEWRKAIDVYLKAIAEVESGAEAHPDLSVYNRLGDLYLKTSDTNAAIRTYERAAELYSEQGFYNNAIALCGKILRLNPQRSSVYLKLATLHARKNVIIEAKRNVLAYMEKMHAAGQLDEAFAAVRAAADQFGTNPELRLMLVDLLKAASRGNEADAELAKLEASASSDLPAAVAGLPLLDVSSAPMPPPAATTSPAAAQPAAPAPATRSSELVFLDVGSPLDAAPEPALPLIQADPIPVVSVADELSPFPTGQSAPPVPMEGRAQLDATLQGMDVQSVADGLELPPTISDAEIGAAPLEGIEQTIFEPTAAESAPLDGLDRHTDAMLDEARAAAPLEGLEPTVGDATLDETAGEVAALEETVLGDAASDETAVEVEAIGTALGENLDVAADDAEALESDVEIIAIAGVVDDTDITDSAPKAEAGDARMRDDALDITVTAPALEPIEADEGEPAAVPPSDEPTTVVPDLPILMADAMLVPDEVADAPEFAETALVTGFDDAVMADLTASDAVEAQAPPEDAADVPDAMDAVDAPELIVADAADAENAEASLPSEDADAMLPITAVPEREAPDVLDSGAFDMDGVIVAVASVEAEEAVEESTTTDEQATAAAFDAIAAEVAGPPDFESAAPSDRLLTLIEELEAKILDDPGVPETHHRLADALLELGDVDRAVEELGLALAGYEAADHLVPAWALADRLAAMRPDNIRFHQKRVEIAFRLEDRHKLIDAYLALGDALVRAGALDKALAVYRRVLDHDPANRVAHRALESYAPRPAPPPARPAASTAPTEAEPASSAEDFVDLGAMILEPEKVRDTRMTTAIREPTGDEQRDFEEALAAFKRGIEENLDDGDYEAHYDLGVAFKEMGLLDEAIAEFQKALRAPEGRLRTSESLGQAFFEKGQPAVAEAVLRRAVESLDGGDDAKVGVLYWLGRAAEAQGRNIEALAAYERTMAVDIRFADAADRAQRLGAGRPA
jgi:tetratricopeptide (TPR) repeat protein